MMTEKCKFIKQLDGLPHHKPKAEFADLVMSEIVQLELISPLYTSTSVSKSFLSLTPGFFAYCTAALAVLIIYLLFPFSDSLDNNLYAFTILGIESRSLSAEGERLVTVKGEETRISPGEGLGLIVLHENSIIETLAKGVALHRGKAYFDLSLKGQVFNIKTSEGIITVFGTAFLVDIDDERLIVTVDEGVVGFSNKTDDVRIPAGQCLTVINNEISVFSKNEKSGPTNAADRAVRSYKQSFVTSEVIEKTSYSSSDSGYNESEGDFDTSVYKPEELPLSGVKATIQSTSDLEHPFGN